MNIDQLQKYSERATTTRVRASRSCDLMELNLAINMTRSQIRQITEYYEQIRGALKIIERQRDAIIEAKDAAAAVRSREL